MEYAKRAWWPFERLMMEDLSFAMDPIDRRIRDAQRIPEILIDRFVFLLGRNLGYVGAVWTAEEIRKALTA